MDFVVGCSSHGITAGERIGAGNVQVILQRDQLRGPVRVAQSIESEVRSDARAALRAGEELEQDDAVMMRIGAAGVRIGLDRFKMPLLLLGQQVLQLLQSRFRLSDYVGLGGSTGCVDQARLRPDPLFRGCVVAQVPQGSLGDFQVERGIPGISELGHRLTHARHHGQRFPQTLRETPALDRFFSCRPSDTSEFSPVAPSMLEWRRTTRD